MKSVIIRMDFDKLNGFVKAVTSAYVVDVGIMVRKSNRKDAKGMTNADIGFIHEFGYPPKNIEKRSFLRMPLFQKSEDILNYVNYMGALKKLADGKMVQVLIDLGIACERAIGEAFATHGFGSWKPVKRGGSPLIDTGQLRRSISSVVTAV